MSSIGDLPVFVQPPLQMTTATAAKITAGKAYQIGGVVREIGSGRLVELLQDAAPLEEAAKQSARKLSQLTARFNLSKVDVTKLDLKTAGSAAGLLLFGGAAVRGDTCG